MIRNASRAGIWLGAALALSFAIPATAQEGDSARRRQVIAESLKRVNAERSTRAQRPAQSAARPRVQTARPQTPRPVLERRSTPPTAQRPQARRPVLQQPETRRPVFQRPQTRGPVLRRPEPRQDFGNPIVRTPREAIPRGVSEYRTSTGSTTRRDEIREVRPGQPPFSPDWRARPGDRRELDRDRDRRDYRPRYRTRTRVIHHHHFHHRFGLHRSFWYHHHRRFGGFGIHGGGWRFVIVIGTPVLVTHHHHVHHGWWDGSRSSLRRYDSSYVRQIGTYDFSATRCVELHLRTREGEVHRIEIDPRRYNARDPGDLYASLWGELDRYGQLEIQDLGGVLYVFPEGLLQEIEAAPCY